MHTCIHTYMHTYIHANPKPFLENPKPVLTKKRLQNYRNDIGMARHWAVQVYTADNTSCVKRDDGMRAPVERKGGDTTMTDDP